MAQEIIWNSTGAVVARDTETGVETIIAPPEAVNAATIRDRARQALITNTAYLALNPPTTAQALSQVGYLTRECSALIRLAVNALDTADGT